MCGLRFVWFDLFHFALLNLESKKCLEELDQQLDEANNLRVNNGVVDSFDFAGADLVDLLGKQAANECVDVFNLILKIFACHLTGSSSFEDIG